MKRMLAKRSKLVLVPALACMLACSALAGGCQNLTKEVQADDLLADLTASQNTKEPDETTVQTLEKATADWSMALLKQCYEGKNTCISPLSVEMALVLAANGAKGETLDQMLTVLAGENANIEDLNAFLKLFRTERLGTEDSQTKVQIANSIWVNSSFSDKRPTAQYLQTVRDYYEASAFYLPFDAEAQNKINSWCADKTDNQIQKALDDIDSGALLYLINALNFEAKWETPYESYQVDKDTFTNEDGSESETDFMHSEEGIYLTCDGGQGMMKYYEDGYAFVALLPEEGTTVADLLGGLDGDAWMTMIENKESATVYADLPKFSYDDSYEMSEVLQAMGMEDAFDGDRADFTGLVDNAESLAISRVIHKTHIDVDEAGTKAAAVTIVEMLEGCWIDEEKIYNLTFDRPFVYAIMDLHTNMPLFVGTVNSL